MTDVGLSEKVAIVGSREGADLEFVASYVRGIAAKYPDTIIVSGGAVGVDKTTETTALAHGLRVISFRPKKFRHDEVEGEEWGVSRVELGGGVARVFDVLGIFTVRSYSQACWLRNFLIADECVRLCLFHKPNWRGGGGMTEEIARGQGKPTYVYEYGERKL